MIRFLTVLAAGVLLLAGCGSTVDAISAVAPTLPPDTLSAPVAAPAKVAIPALNVEDNIVPVGLDADGGLAVPDVHETGWLNASPAPGMVGPALLAGHVNYQGSAGALAHIGDLKAGDRVDVTDMAGATTSFAVYQVDELGKAFIDWAQVLADRPGPELVLVTCSGQIVDHQYTDNTIVRARLVTA